MSLNVLGGGLEFDATIDGTQFQAQMNRMEGQLNRFSNDVKSKTSQLDGLAGKATALAAAYFSVTAATNFVQSMVQVRGAFQQIEVAYSTMLKSKEKGDKLFAESVKLAAITPFALQDVANGAKQLLAYGFGAEKITENLTTLGNVAAGVGAPLNDIVYIYGTLKTQGRAYQRDILQFTSRGIPIVAELAKQFGVTESKVTELVGAGKVGFPEIETAFNNLTGSAGIFYNLMEKQSKTLTGQISNLGDAWDTMLNSLGESQEGIFSDSIGAVTSLIENYENVIKIIEVLIITYGVYRAALIVNTLATTGLTIAETLHYAALVIAEKAQKLLNLTTMSNPYIAVAVVLAALITSIYVFSDSLTTAEKAQKGLNKITEEGKNTMDALKTSVQSLNAIISDKNQTDFQQNKAYAELQRLYPGFLANMSKEEYQKLALVDAQKLLNKENDNKQISFIGDKYKKAQEDVKKLKEDIEAYNQTSRTSGSIAGANGVMLGSMNEKLELAKELATRLAYAYRKQKEELAFSLLSDKDKVSFLEKQQKELEKQVNTAKRLRDAAGGFNDFLNNINLDALNKQLTDVTAKISVITGKGDATKPVIRSESFIEKQIDDLKSANKELDISSSIYKSNLAKIKGFQDELSRAQGKVSKEQSKAGDDRLTVLNKVAEAEKEALRKGLTNNQSEIQAIKDKYKTLRDEAKKAGLGGGVLTRIDNAEKSETGSLKYQQETEELKKSLSEKKKLYSDFENYRNEVGQENAVKRYQAEIDTSKTYLQTLQEEFDKIKGSDLSGGEQERKKNLAESIKAETDNQKAIQDRAFIEAIKSTITFEEEKQAIVDKYAKIKADLLKNIDKLAPGEYAKKVAIADLQAKEETDKVNETQLLKTEAIKTFYDGVDEMSTKSAKTVIANAKIELEASNLSADAKKKILNDLDSASKAIEDRLPKKLGDLASELGKVANAIKPIDANFADILGTVANVIGGVGQIKSSLADLKEAQKVGADGKSDILGQFIAGLGIAGAGIGIITGIFSQINKGKEQRKKEEREQIEYSSAMQMKAIDAQTKAMERQLALIKDIYGAERIQKYGQSLVDLQQKQAESAKLSQEKLLLTGDKKVDDLVKRLNAGESQKSIFKDLFKPLDPAKSKYINDFFDKVNAGKSSKLSIDLAKGADEIERLQQLLDSGKLDETTAKNVQSLITYTKQYQDTLNALKAETTGSTFEDIGNSIVDMFAKGITSAEDFGKNFEEIMKKSILQTFKGQVLNKALQEYYDTFAEYSKSGNGLDSGEIDALRKQYNDIIANSQKQFDNLQQATGVDFSAGADASTKNTLSGAIKGITADQADLLAGQFGGLRLTQLLTNDILNFQLTVQKNQLTVQSGMASSLVNIEKHTLRTADNTDQLFDIKTDIKTIASKIDSAANALKAGGKI